MERSRKVAGLLRQLDDGVDAVSLAVSGVLSGLGAAASLRGLLEGPVLGLASRVSVVA